MKLDGPELRARRLQLGQSTRGLARETHVSQTLIKRLEETGDVGSITCATLQDILNALSLDLVEILDQNELLPSCNARDLEHVGAILVEQRRGITPAALAQQLSISLSTLETQLEDLATRLGPAGIRVHRGSTGIRLIPARSTDNSAVRGARVLETPSNTDLRLLHRAMGGKLHTREVATMKNGNISLHRVTSAGLMELLNDGSLTLGVVAREALLVDHP